MWEPSTNKDAYVDVPTSQEEADFLYALELNHQFNYATPGEVFEGMAYHANAAGYYGSNSLFSHSGDSLYTDDRSNYTHAEPKNAIDQEEADRLYAEQLQAEFERMDYGQGVQDTMVGESNA